MYHTYFVPGRLSVAVGVAEQPAWDTGSTLRNSSDGGDCCGEAPELLHNSTTSLTGHVMLNALQKGFAGNLCGQVTPRGV